MMATLTGLAKRHPLLGFFALAYALSWWPWLWYRLDPAAADGPILPFGPLLAAAIMLALTGGWPAVARLAWRRSPHGASASLWYALALLLPAAITAMAVGVNLFLGAELPPGAALPGWGDLALRFVVIFVLIGLGEEPAWRGYALPRLIAGRTRACRRAHPRPAARALAPAAVRRRLRSRQSVAVAGRGARRYRS